MHKYTQVMYILHATPALGTGCTPGKDECQRIISKNAANAVKWDFFGHFDGCNSFVIVI